MRKNIFIAIIIFITIIFGVYLLTHKKNTPSNSQILHKFNVVLDWTPNTNHTGLYVALEKGWYKDEGLNVIILPYSSTVAPDLLVSTGKADAGVSAAEGVVNDAAAGQPVVSIGAIIAHNTSGFLALKESGITRPADLDNKIDGGSGSPLETAIVSAIIRYDGGVGKFKSVALDASAMQALESKRVDFFWVFEGWEVIAAKRQDLKTIYFPSLKYGIPDYYTPVFITSPTEIKDNPDDLKKFMRATAKGYNFAISNPKEAAQILINSVTKGTFPDTGLVIESQEFVSGRYADTVRPWGKQEKEMWHNYPQFMIDAGAVLDTNGKKVTQMDFDKLYTNEFLPN